MADGKKTYFQVSFTGGQALLAVVSLVLGLGLAFFFGAKAGFERAAEPEPGPAARETRPIAAPAPATATGTATEPAPALSSTASSNASASEEAPVFEDREAGVSEEPKGAGTASPSSPSRTEIAGSTSTPAIAAPKEAKGEKPPSGAAAGKTSVSPAPDAVAKKSLSAAAKKGGYFVQVLSTASMSEASRWKDRLTAKSYHSVAVTTVDSKKGKLYRVRTGPYPNRAQANKVAAKINAEFRQKAWVASE